MKKTSLFPVITIALSIVVALQYASAQQQTPVTPFSHSLQAGARAVQVDELQPVKLKDTVHVLAVMVEFLEDSDSRTSGTGKFGTIYPGDYGTSILDPLPHDRAYFENHLTFLRNYVRKASGGQTNLTTTIMSNIVTVSGKIQDYSDPRDASIQPTADFAVAAWTAADAAHPGFDFSDYDMFIIFHAGRGKDVDMTSITGSNSTPYDIPSISFTLNAFRELYGESYDGIPVSGGAFTITNSSIVPTTDSREYELITGQTALLQLTINGLLAASFGTYAGLPDLFNTESGETGIGRFGLMDSESIFAYSGICPPAPSAWEKVMLGWAKPRQASAGANEYSLTAQRTDNITIPDIIQVPITGSEYWLIENRHRDPQGNGQKITMMNSGVESSLVFAKDTTSFSNSDVSALSGVITDVEDLDWSLPGGTVQVDNAQIQGVNGGILIWHIDESIIEEHLASNTVNANPDARGVDLEQAGGAQDIGVTTSTLFGDVIGSGSALDYWFDGNIGPLYENRFGAKTYPDTRSNSGAYTHVTMSNFSARGPLMFFTISIGDDVIAPLDGYPVNLRSYIAADSARMYVQTADVTGNSEHELFVAASGRYTASVDSGFVFAMTMDKNPVLAGAASTIAIAEAGIKEWSGAPLIGDITGDGVPECIVYGRVPNGGRVSVYSVADANSDHRFDFLYSFDYTGTTASGLTPTIHNGTLYMLVPFAGGKDTLYTGNASLTRYAIDPLDGASGAHYTTLASFPGTSSLLLAHEGATGILDSESQQTGTAHTTSLPFFGFPTEGDAVYNSVVSDFDGDGTSEAAALRRNYLDILSLNADAATQNAGNLSSSIPLQIFPATLASADADGDGRNDILIAGSDQVLVYNYALASVDHYPAVYGAEYNLAARFPGATSDAIFAVGSRQLSQIVTGAQQADGFPVPLPEDASVTLFPIGTSNAQLGIAVVGSDGKLFVFETQNAVDENTFVWRSIFGDEANSNYAPGQGETDAPMVEFFPKDRCYNWPNPVYDPVTKFRYYVSVNADITIKIYDLAGDNVDELHATAIGGTDNEIDWNVSDIQSGVYLARVEASAGGVTEYKIIRVAVVK